MSVPDYVDLQGRSSAEFVLSADQEHRRRLAHIADVSLEDEFRRVSAASDEAVIAVFFGPGPDKGQRVQAIETIDGPEIDKNHLAARRLQRQRRRIQPFDSAGEAGPPPFERKVSQHRGGDLLTGPTFA